MFLLFLAISSIVFIEDFVDFLDVIHIVTLDQRFLVLILISFIRLYESLAVVISLDNQGRILQFLIDQRFIIELFDPIFPEK